MRDSALHHATGTGQSADGATTDPALTSEPAWGTGAAFALGGLAAIADGLRRLIKGAPEEGGSRLMGFAEIATGLGALANSVSLLLRGTHLISLGKSQRDADTPEHER